jgi:alpha-galactosidase
MASFGGRYSAPGGFSDADNILGPHGTVGVVTEAQARAQMILWSLFPSQLILGEDVTRASPEFIATVGNDELLAVNADAPFAGGARRVAGSDLAWPCAGGALPPGALFALRALPCDAGDALQRWAFVPSDGSLRLASPPPGAEGARAALAPGAAADDGALVYVFAPGAGGGATFAPAADGKVVGPGGKCLDEYMYTTPRVDIWDCVKQANEVWLPRAGGALVNNDSGLCLAAAPPGTDDDCTNVWARPLHDGGLALGFVNNAPDAAVVECGADCFAAANASAAPRWRVRDMIAHEDLGVILPPFALRVNVSGGGAGAALRLFPV